MCFEFSQRSLSKISTIMKFHDQLLGYICVLAYLTSNDDIDVRHFHKFCCLYGWC